MGRPAASGATWETYRIGSITPALAKNARACPERSRRDGAPEIPFWEREVKTRERACHPPSKQKR